jgi:hypothetical protein
MDAQLLSSFQLQVYLQCKFVVLAADDLNRALKSPMVEYAWYTIQNLLNASANMSKALWGGGGRLAKERKALRESIGISDDSPLKEVGMRNNFEHLDERLDRWWRESKGHNYLDLDIGPKPKTNFWAPIDTFRFFDPTTNELVFWGQEFNIQQIVDECRTLLPKLEELVGRPLKGSAQKERKA